jgi:hypothetical protein
LDSIERGIKKFRGGHWFGKWLNISKSAINSRKYFILTANLDGLDILINIVDSKNNVLTT